MVWDFVMKIGQNIRRLREARNLSQWELAARLQVRGCDITRSALAKMEVGQRHIYCDEIYLLKDILSAEYNDFFHEE